MKKLMIFISKVVKFVNSISLNASEGNPMANVFLEGSLPNESRLMDYKIMDYRVVANKDRVLYGYDCDLHKIRRSTDGGMTWSQPLASLSGQINTVLAKLVKRFFNRFASLSGWIRAGVVTDAGIVVLVDTLGKVWRSDNQGVTFKQVNSGFNCLANGMDVNGETIIYGEYTCDSGPYTVNVYKSTDGGLNWASVLSKTNIEITHFHTVTYKRELGAWLVTSGDAGTGSFIWGSYDDGKTWTVIIGGSSIYRMVGLVSTSFNVLVWAADNSPNTCVYAGFTDDLINTTRRIGILPGHSLGIAGGKDLIVTSCRIETKDPKGSQLNPIYVSSDGGASWFMDYYVSSKAINAGYEGILGPNIYGDFYLQFCGIFESSMPQVTIKATPKRSPQVNPQPVKYTYTEVPYSRTLIDTLQMRDTFTHWSAVTKEKIFEAVVHIQNNLDTSINCNIFDGTTLYKVHGTKVGVTVAAGMHMIVSLDELDIKGGFSAISAGFCLGASAINGTPTFGDLTVILSGKVLRSVDHRQRHQEL